MMKTISDVLAPIRRVITDNNTSGKSFFLEDGPSPSIKKVPERPGYRVTNLWRTTESPVKVHAPDTITQHVGVLPAPLGNVLRIIDYPPEPKDPAEIKRLQDATFSQLYKDAGHHLKPGDHPGMHITKTVDYALVLAGEMTAIMETEETVLRAGDVLIQRGTNHAWANRSDFPARIAFILIDGQD
jgi:mannose-6-phosphate isomerase-like protein (cupin superfamily)